jgi:AcrR family transcriptional regulator
VSDTHGHEHVLARAERPSFTPEPDTHAALQHSPALLLGRVVVLADPASGLHLNAEADAPFGSIYHHFPGGKEQLCEEVIQAGGTFFLILVGTVYQAEPDAISGLRAVFDAAAETLEATDYADACPIATIALEVASTNECLRQASANAFQTWLDALTARLQADGCPPSQAPQLATATIAALEGAFVLARTQRSTVPLHAAKAMVEQSFTHALHRA